MKCEFDFSAYYDGEADNAEEISAHLAECSACTREYEKFCELMNEIKNLPEPQLPSGFYDGLIGAVRRDNFARRRRNRRLTFGQFSLAAAASVLLVLVIGTMGLDFGAGEDRVVSDMAGTVAEVTSVEMTDAMPRGWRAEFDMVFDMPVTEGGGADEMYMAEDDFFDEDFLYGGIVSFDEDLREWVLESEPETAAEEATEEVQFALDAPPAPAFSPSAQDAPEEARLAIETRSRENLTQEPIFGANVDGQNRQPELQSDILDTFVVATEDAEILWSFPEPAVLSERVYVPYQPSSSWGFIGYIFLAAIVISAIAGIIFMQKRKSDE